MTSAWSLKSVGLVICCRSIRTLNSEMFRKELITVFLVLVLSSSKCWASYYLPGVTPVSFNQGDTVWFNSMRYKGLKNLPFGDIGSETTPSHLIVWHVHQVSLKANKVTSTKTPLQYDYYDLPFCKRRRTKAKADNIGERLSGDSLTTSPYEVRCCISIHSQL